ncbi:hypothetical protein NHX12_001949 [Muraenolepis orangiensis]|uniref:CDK5 regulatory subunit-associated protein 2/Myomegalin coiled coil domain-containing protein n=1 Tax=Muraenolepis orangiensis TaxID=630683 RepID=A0A9Q0E1Q2_9TELE|nr:hypothetical protein NHX12_001949 [Muraenolepis orangiensis]
MKDLCRVCGVHLVGSQRRWIFSATGQRRLQVILSHVLGCGVTRGDGRGEFLCGKCVFQFEKVVHCDIAIDRLQDEHSTRVQKLQVEKDHLIQCLVHVYSKNNVSRAKGEGDNSRSKIPVRSFGCGSPVDNVDYDEVVGQLPSKSQSHRNAEMGQMKNPMRRCASLDRLGGKAATPARFGLRRLSTRLGSGLILEGSSGGLKAARHHSQSMYLDMVSHKGTMPSPGFKGCSMSLQSVNQDFASGTFSDHQPKRHLRESKAFSARESITDGSKGKAQARTLLCRCTVQPSLISDLIQLLRCISRRQVLHTPDSRIPVLQRPHTGHMLPNLLRTKHRSREAQWKSLRDLTEEFNDEYTPVTAKGFTKIEHDIGQLESTNKLLNKELSQMKSSNECLTKTLEEAQNQNKTLSGTLDERENNLCSEKKNSLKRDKTIQGLSQVLKEKEKEILELCHEIEDRDEALAKARETAHKAQLQKYQGAEEHQSLLMEKQAELAQLQGEHHTKVLEAQKMQRSLVRKEQELADMQQAKEQLEDMQNQLNKLSGEIRDRESSLEQQYQGLLDQTNRKLQVHEVTIQRLTSSLADKEKQLQDYMNMVKDLEQSRSPGGSDMALDEKFAAVEEKDNEIHQLQLTLREKERDLERLNNFLTHNNEIINSFDGVIKEKDVELQHLVNTLKNLQRAKQDMEDNLNRALRDKDSIMNQLQLSLQGKTKDMEEMAQAMLSQSQSQASDLAEQMRQRLKVTEAMLAEATKARENLVADNKSAVEGLLATIGSKDLLLKESSEHHNRMLSEYTREIQELKRQLADLQQQLTAAEKHSSTATQGGYPETAELRVLLAQKDDLIKKLLERDQDRDGFLAEPRLKEDSNHVLELRHTVQILQGRLEEREAELSQMNGDNITVTRKTTVLLKKELTQKTDALNKALKRENELKISLAELQSMLAELEVHVKSHEANTECQTSTLDTKDQIIRELHQHLGQRGDRQTGNGQDTASGSGTKVQRSPSSLPQRERTIIGGDSQQKDLPHLSSLHEEHAVLIRALKTEQQLFSSLIRTVKEQDSSQRLHALQLELAAVQLLRQQLEEGIKTNEGLRGELESELHRAQLREGAELESMRHQLEDAQRWNASLQARLGAIQNRAGGVGGADDTGDTLTFLGDQTSYMSICVGEGLQESLSLLSPQELRQKVVELQECVSGLQSVNGELQRKALLLEYREDLGQGNARPRTLSLEAGRDDRQRVNGSDQQSQTEVPPPQEDNMEETVLHSLLGDSGTTPTSQLRDDLLRLRSENGELRRVLREKMLNESERKEAGGDDCDGQASVKETVLRLRAEAEGHLKVIGLLKEQLERKAVEVSDWERRNGNLEGQLTAGLSINKTARQLISQQRSVVRSRLPVPVRLISEPGSTMWRANQPQALHHHTDTTDPLHNMHLNHISESDQLLSEGSDCPLSLEGSTTPDSSSNFPEYNRRSSCSPTVSDMNLEAGEALPGNTQADSGALLAQLELLHQECQEKEGLINGLEDKLAELEDIYCQLQEKDHLNRQYAEALQAAESTIAYLTACSLDSHLSPGPHGGSVGSDTSAALLQRECVELHKTLQEKERLNGHLVEFLSMTGREISTIQASLSSPTPAASHELCSRLESALQQINTSLAAQNPGGTINVPWGSNLGQNTDCLQQGRQELNGLDAECEEGTPSVASDVLPGLNHAGALHEDYFSRQIAGESVHKDSSRDIEGKSGFSEGSLTHGEITKCLSDCLAAAESAIATLAAHCTNTRSSTSLSSGTSTQTRPDLQHHLQRLHISLQELGKLEDPGQVGEPKKPSDRNESAAFAGRESRLELHRNICILYQAFCDRSQRISDLQASLQEERRLREESETQAIAADRQSAEGIPGNIKAQLESLQRALKDKKKMCKILEEKLASSLVPVSTIHNLPRDPAQKMPPLEQDDKCVQVDLLDLGYETSGKSENDREESSSTDLKVCAQPCQSASSLPSLLLKEEQAAFSSSAENLDSTSNSYPSSPALSSHKVSLKSLQAFEDYGVSDDPAELQAQVRELRLQLENQSRVAQQMQSLLGRHIFPSDLVSTPVDSSSSGGHRAWVGVVGGRTQERCHSGGELRESGEGESQRMRDKIGVLSEELERERSLNRNMSEQLHQVQHRSRSASPARIDSLVQSQARELSQLRQQIKETRGLGVSHRRQLQELSRAFQELLQASDVDLLRGDVLRAQLDKSLGILERLEERPEEMQQELLQYLSYPQDSPASIQQEIEYLRLQLEAERELLQQHVHSLVLQNYNLAQSTREQLDLELQEKDRQVQSLQSQLGGQSPSSPRVSASSSSSEVCPSYVVSGSGHSSPTACRGHLAPHGHTDGTRRDHDSAGHGSPPTVGGVKSRGGVARSSGDRAGGGRTQGLLLWRENGRLQEQLRGSEELNDSLRSELELHRSIVAQSEHRHREPEHHDQHRARLGSPPQVESDGKESDACPGSQQDAGRQAMNPDLLAEHLQEIRALRQRLEESIQTNDRLREQLERRLAEVERDPDKHKENDKLREALARRTAKLEQSKAEGVALRQERGRLQDRLELSAQENTQLQDALQRSREELHRLQSDVNLQRQQLSDSQHLLKSLRVELQVCDRIKKDTRNETEVGEVGSGPLDLSELLSEIRHLRLQLERSIQTNTALRQRLEEQLLRGVPGHRPDTININYLLSTSEEGGRSPGRENRDPAHHSSHSRKERTTVLQEPPSRLVPGHRLWASRHGRHVLGLIEDHDALHKRISEGRRLTQDMDAQLQECVQALTQRGSPDSQPVQSLSSSVRTMQQVLEEASRLLQLVWRVSLPTGGNTGGDNGSNQQQQHEDDLLRNEISRLKSRLTQQERLLSGAVKRLRTTNQLKEGMERVIIDQLAVTHGVLKKARGNMEEVPINGQ